MTGKTIWWGGERPPLEPMTLLGENAMPGLLGIEFVDCGDDWITARMPVDARTHQPFGRLHGGASVAFYLSVFMKAITCLTGPNAEVTLPRGSEKTDWEVELGIVIGTRTRYVTQKDALNHVAGYCVVNDVSEREYQLERGATWDKGKGCDTFGPVGPWLVTRDEVPNPQALGMWLDVNGVRFQTGNTKTMIFGVAKLVSYVSQFMTLEPGDIITTGTPPGVGMGVKVDGKPAPVFLKRGDVMRLGIDGLGEQTQKVVAFKL